MDPLSDILRVLRVRSTLYFRAALGAPWALDVPAEVPVVRFHVVVAGSCRVAVQGRAPVRLRRGDLAMVSRGAAHVLSSGPNSTPAPIQRVLDEAAYDGKGALVYGSDGDETLLVCGHFAFEDELSHPIIESLPDFVHIRAEEGHDFAWLNAATRTIGRETAARSPGWMAVVDRASEILFVQVLRIQFTHSPSSVVAAFLDERLALALGAIHAQPERDWNVERLGQIAGMSRTGFAVRFRDLIGMPPMTYLSRWRLQLARQHLLRSSDNVEQIAWHAGYRSEAAFCRAFHQLYGAPPATYRRRFHAAASAN